jgi:hypothetical protein
MPMPFTRPIVVTQTAHTPGTYPRRPGAALALPPSNGVKLPRGGPVVHTVKNPAHVVPTTPHVQPAQVS